MSYREASFRFAEHKRHRI